MTAEVSIARVVESPLDVTEHLRSVHDASAGAIDLFIGTIRDHDPEASGTVTMLEYEAHPEAEATLRRLAEDVAARHGTRIAVSHRFGTLHVGEMAVIVASSSAHRGEAMAATRSLIERIKTELPIWKRQSDDAGTTQWIGIS